MKQYINKQRYKKFLLIVLLFYIIFNSLFFYFYTLKSNIYAQTNNKEEKIKIYSCGIPIGVYLKSNGILVVGYGNIMDSKNRVCSPAYNKLKCGDYILNANGKNLSNIKDLDEVLNLNNNKNYIKLKVKRNETIIPIVVLTVKNRENKNKLGIWVKEDLQGLGTLTYVTKDGKFGALGHGISDYDTKKIFDINGGTIYKPNVWGIKKNTPFSIGSICGNIDFSQKNILGSIRDNNHLGIYGLINKNINLDEFPEMEVLNKNKVLLGDVKIQCVLDKKIKFYDAKIIKINKNSKDLEKGMVIKITDTELLSKTNGIIQGMSGSPIIQNNKIIGAVTHVIVDNSTTGYGVFIENMLEND